MRLEQTEDWNPMQEMIKNFGDKAGQQTTGLTVIPEMSEEASNKKKYEELVKELEKNLLSSKRECDV
eukprot:UN26505